MNFYISDTHFGHKNCLHLDNRPFKTIEEHDACLITNWNARVNPGDMVYILGDFCWGKEKEWNELLPKLNGQKTLIRGNHDLREPQIRGLFADVKDKKEIDDNGRKIVLNHEPIPCFKNHFYGWYHFYGHVHASFEWNMMEHDRYLMEQLYERPCEMYNVGAMMPYIQYTPRTFEEIIEGYKRMI